MGSFAEYVRRTSFSLSLSKQQVELLLLFYEHGKNIDEVVKPGHFLSIAIRLEEKGLVRHNPDWKPSFTPKWPAWELTHAGFLVSELLKEAKFDEPESES